MIKLTLLSLIALFWCSGSMATPLNDFYRHFGELTRKYWHPSVVIHEIPTTVFDYKKMHLDSKNRNSSFYKALNALKNINPSDLNKGNQEKAFWINAYNFAAIKLVLENYPIDSIRSMKVSLFKHPWSVDAVQIGKKDYSLTKIEKDILLKKYNDPRIVFAVSCAAISCPDRTNEIFLPDKLNEQMDSLIATFFKNEKKGFSLDKERKVLTLAWILKKDGHLFKSGDEANVLDFVLKYIGSEDRQWVNQHRDKLKIEYFDHDWGLNDLAFKKAK